jgi:hypothetical protein
MTEPKTEPAVTSKKPATEPNPLLAFEEAKVIEKKIFLLISMALTFIPENIQRSLILEQIYNDSEYLWLKELLRFLQFYGSNMAGMVAVGLVLPVIEHSFLPKALKQRQEVLVALTVLNTVAAATGIYLVEYYFTDMMYFNRNPFVADMGDVVFPTIAFMVTIILMSAYLFNVETERAELEENEEKLSSGDILT